MPRPPIPTVGGDRDAWGTKNNAVLADLQSSADALQVEVDSKYDSSVVDGLVSGVAASAATRIPLMPMYSGGQYSTVTHGFGKSGNLAGVSLAANVLLASPVFIPTSVSVSSLHCYVTASVVGNIRMGLFTVDLSTYNATLIVDGGSVSTNSVGDKSIAFSSTAIGPGVYWIGAVADVAVTLYHVAPVTGFLHHSTYNPICGIAKTYTYAPFTPTITAVNGASLNLPVFTVGIA